MKVKYLLIALLTALTIALVACDGDADPAVTTDASSTAATAAASTTEAGNAESTASTSTSATSVATSATTTKSGIIELPPVDVR